MGYGLAVRPVVSLKPNMLESDLAKLKENQTETETISWNGFTRNFNDRFLGTGDYTTGKAGTQTGHVDNTETGNTEATNTETRDEAQ